MSSDKLTHQSSPMPFSKDELKTYRTRLKLGIFRQLRSLFARLQKSEGLTQKQLALRLDVDEAIISRRLKGEANLTLDTLCDLARAMNARIDVKVTPLADVVALANQQAISKSTSHYSIILGKAFVPAIGAVSIPLHIKDGVLAVNTNQKMIARGFALTPQQEHRMVH